MPFHWGSADGERGGMAAVRKSFALVIGFLTYCRCCCYSLSMTFNEEFTDPDFGLHSELRAKIKKGCCSFCQRNDRISVRLVQHWELLVIFGRESSSGIQSCLHSSVYLCWIYIHVYLSSVTPIPLAFLFLSFHLFQPICMYKWKDNCFVQQFLAYSTLGFRSQFGWSPKGVFGAITLVLQPLKDR